MMGIKMKEEKFSAFIDNELNEAEFDEMYSALSSDKDFKRRWQRYHIISDTLQKHLPEKFDCKLADQVMLKLENEPAIFVPEHTSQYDLSPVSTAGKATVTTLATKKPFFKQIAGLAVAASVMVVAVFVTQTFVTNNGTTAVAPVASVPSMPAESQFARISGSQPKASSGYQSQLNKYLANHNQYSTSVPGVMPYARIIGYTPDQPQRHSIRQADK